MVRLISSRKHSLLPNDRGDLFGIIAALFLVTLITAYELNTIYKLYEDHKQNHPDHMLSIYITLTIGLYILFNVLVNMYYAISTDTSVYAIQNQLPNTLKAEWSYCNICELNTPPRSYHCIICEKCVLRRSNHCLFLGKCCGYFNSRYYYMFIIYLWFGTIFSNYLNLEYLLDIANNGFTLKTLLITFMPTLAWLFGIVDNLRLLTVFINTACILIFLILFLYLVINFKLIRYGQTWYENVRKNFEYNLGFAENFVQIFGTNWLHAFIWPFSEYKLSGDGINYRKALDSGLNRSGKFI